MKNAQKALLVIAGMAVLAACSLFNMNSIQKSSGSAAATIADGTRPMPPVTSIAITDGTRPMPPTTPIAIADGTRPMPPITSGGTVISYGV